MTLRQCALISLLFALLALGSGARAQNCSLAGRGLVRIPEIPAVVLRRLSLRQEHP